MGVVLLTLEEGLGTWVCSGVFPNSGYVPSRTTSRWVTPLDDGSSTTQGTRTSSG